MGKEEHCKSRGLYFCLQKIETKIMNWKQFFDTAQNSISS